MMRTAQRNLLLSLLAIVFVAEFDVPQSLASPSPGDSIVRFDTTLGSFDVELFNSAAPITVANFLDYVTSGRYEDTLVHRSIPAFVIQGGGFNVSDSGAGLITTPVPAFPPISHETGLHNVRGTIAIATPPGNPNGGTSQWFINLADNSANLDVQNGGFAVFGQVLGSGMTVVDAIAALPRINVSIVFADLPIVSSPVGGSLQKSNLVFVNDIHVVPEPGSAALAGMAVVCCVAGRIFVRRR
jgi:peptidyl-prolyl cis-trans isomerase A (cyclophilin A)